HHVNGTLKPCPHKLNPTPKCIEKCQSAYTKTYSEDKYFGKQAYSVEEHVQSIQKELMTRGPVEAAFEVYEDFEVYKSDILVT
uniref:Peptidase C1A papain C-terminal domain-containing protein n=1 Tax=Romanomermis culicivorax TaxID=13658 RepID=A0A915J3I8_ROMCU